MEQLYFPFDFDKTDLDAYLTRALTIENEQERLREDLRLLKEEYAAKLPLRGLQAAVKVLRTRRKLAEHPKEPMTYAEQDALQAVVESHILTMDLERQVPAMFNGQKG